MTCALCHSAVGPLRQIPHTAPEPALVAFECRDHIACRQRVIADLRAA